jgi:hypothetical protein
MDRFSELSGSPRTESSIARPRSLRPQVVDPEPMAVLALEATLLADSLKLSAARLIHTVVAFWPIRSRPCDDPIMSKSAIIFIIINTSSFKPRLVTTLSDPLLLM